MLSPTSSDFRVRFEVVSALSLAAILSATASTKGDNLDTISTFSFVVETIKWVLLVSVFPLGLTSSVDFDEWSLNSVLSTFT